MPKRYKLKFGGAEGVSQSMDTTPLIIGIILLCFFLPIIGFIGYYVFYVNKCQDKVDGELKYKDLCPAGKNLNNKTCEDECDEGECCEEYNCNPPTSLPTGYKLKSGQSLSTTTFKSISEFPADISSKVECDTDSHYTGTPTGLSCAGNEDKKWTLSGCELTGIESCATGANPHDNGHPGTVNGPRSRVNDCGSIDLDHITGDNSNILQQVECDSKYQSNGKFCKWISRGFEGLEYGNRCTESTTSCALP